ncbi:acyl-CoA thioesterase [Evansella cellulosilytica]|uniref:Thioesterase superfamily protein n=1 Tax=Evansella cellulosilytica (strain ATCC 21833 / DSM 2522 / FERM P-1141 / JCM 9156 / N-4) TaxID=649639 RepID=E6U237_EVAC2|nr:thioesterase family protein [Evansella cellulosilytica]ADU30415.1 thioesterase superfamily protein [Evansella cellulosilytica DSM 2522]
MLVSSEEIAVRYAETDQMGVVYHANYLIWCEIGRTKYIEALGYKYADLEKMGVLSPVTSLQMKYHYPAKYGESITVETWVESYNGIRVIYGYEITNSLGQKCLTGTSEHVCVKKDTFKPISIKKHFPEWHESYEKHKK